MKKKFKAKLRNYLFKDYKWVTRAEVVQIICATQWVNKDNHKIVRILEEIKTQIK